MNFLKYIKETKENFVGNIEQLTTENDNFREVLFTGKHAQLVVMCLQEGEEIGDEVHEDVDQFFRIEEGTAQFILNETEKHTVGTGGSVVVTAGTYHNVINTGNGSLRLYTVYSPPNHPDGTIHKTKADATAAEGEE